MLAWHRLPIVMPNVRPLFLHIPVTPASPVSHWRLHSNVQKTLLKAVHQHTQNRHCNQLFFSQNRVLTRPKTPSASRASPDRYPRAPGPAAHLLPLSDGRKPSSSLLPPPPALPGLDHAHSFTRHHEMLQSVHGRFASWLVGCSYI